MERWLYAWGTGYAAIGTTSVLLPLYAIELGGGALIVGLITATAAFTAVPGALLWGFIAGQIERSRPFVLGALTGSSVLLFLTPFVDDPWSLILVNAILWFTVAAAAPVICLLVVEGTTQTKWDEEIGRLNMVQGYGWMFGITFGTVWTVTLSDHFSTILVEEMLFRFLSATVFLAAIVMLTWYPSRPTITSREFVEGLEYLEETDWGASRFVRAIPYGQTRLYWTITAFVAIRREGRHPFSSFEAPIRRYLLATILFFAGFSIFWAPLPAYVVEIGHETQVVFGLILITNFGAFIGYGPMGTFFGRDDLWLMQAISLIARAILIGAIVVTVLLMPEWNLPILAWLFLLVGGTWSVVGGTSPGIVTDLAPKEYESEAIGVFTVVAGFAAGAGAVVGGWVSEYVSYSLAFVLASILILIGAALIPRD